MKQSRHIQETVTALNQGGLVLFPTDTAYGIGCRMDNEQALRRLNRLLKRPADQPLPVLVDSPQMAMKYLLPLPEEVVQLMLQHWPGGLTIVYYCKSALVLSEVRGGGRTLGVRMPDFNPILEVIKKIKVPLVGTSANVHGADTPYRFGEVDKSLIYAAQAVFKGECKLGRYSTVVDCTTKPWKVLRRGAVRL